MNIVRFVESSGSVRFRDLGVRFDDFALTLSSVRFDTFGGVRFA